MTWPAGIGRAGGRRLLIRRRGRVDQAQTDGGGGCLDPVADGELAQDVGDVDAGGLRADERLLPDLPVGVAGGEQLQHGDFAVGEAMRMGLRRSRLPLLQRLIIQVVAGLRRPCRVRLGEQAPDLGGVVGLLREGVGVPLAAGLVDEVTAVHVNGPR